MSSPKPSGTPRTPPRKTAYGVGLGLTLASFGVLLLPGSRRFYAPGAPTPGHATVACAQCHTPAPGTIRQQIQANVRHLLGRRERGADFVHQAVGNAQCVTCHPHDNDPHASARFNEPSYEQIRRTLAPQFCASCHQEHTGRVVKTSLPATFCAQCHQGMAVANDRVTPSHADLAGTGEWSSCLRCHDYHGNHQRTPARELSKGLSEASVRDYLAGGPSPYGPLRAPMQSK